MSSNNKLIISIFVIPVLIFVGILFFNNINKAPTSSPVRQGQNQTNSSNNYNFTANEVPAFNFPSVAYASDLKKNISVYDPKGEKMNADVTVSANKNGSSVQVNKTQQFIPGKYSLVINQDGKKIEQDFTWGVLAINPNKSIYAPGEVAKLALAVLDEKGNMVCDANVTLDIKDPSGQTTTLSAQNGTITVNPECQQKKYTVNPDYETKYQVGSLGNYQMSLTAVTKNGTYNIVDFFTVEENREFDVERTTGTRIFPYSIYPVSIKIIAKKDFTGQIRELAPASLTMTPLENTVSYNSIEKNTEIQYLVWDVSLKKGESINIGYNFKAPLISPQFYLLGPLSLASGNTSVFEENRAWQLAIDAVSYSTTILNTSGLVAYWRLGEASGNPQDSAGTNHVDVVGGTPTYSQTGAIAGDSNTAILLDGATEYFRMPDAASLDLGDYPWTFEVWAQRSATGEFNNMFDKGYNAPWVGVNDTNKFVIYVNGVGFVSEQVGTFPTDAYYHHCVATFDGTTVKLYVDGVDVSGATTDMTFSSTDDPVHLGTGAYEAAEWWNGKLDEAAIYNVVLTPTQVLDHYNTGVALNADLSCDYPDTILADTPVAYWRLGEASGNPQDSAGTNHVTVVGGTPTYGVTGALSGDADKAITLGGAAYFTVPDVAALDLGDGPYTHELWVKRGATGTVQVIVTKGAGTLALVFPASNAVRLATNSVADIVDSTTTIADTTTFHHIVVTKNGAAVKLYIDGVDRTGTVTNNTQTNSASALNIGRDTSGDYLFTGTIDEYAIYNVVLSAATVLDHYNTGMATSCGSGNFRFDGLQMNGIKIN